MEDLIKCSGINKSYGKKHVLKDFAVDIKAGQIVGLLGPNGSGKSTFIKYLAGVLTPESGDISIGGYSVGIESKKIVSYLPERSYLDPALKVKDAVGMFKDFYEDFDEDIAKDMLGKLDIDTDATIKSLSKGTREKVQLVLVMSRRAKLYILDEPIGGVDPAARDFILKTILTNYNSAASIILSTHLISDIEKILDDIIFIKEGEINIHETADNLREQHEKSIDALFREVYAC